MSDNTAYVLEVNLENLVEGEPILIPGLGEFKNGSSYEVSQEEADAFRVYHTSQVSETDGEGNTTTKVEKGPTLLQASRGMFGVTVSTPGHKDEDPDEDDEDDLDEDPDNDEPEGGEG